MDFKKTSSEDFKKFKEYAKTFYVETERICRIIPAYGDADLPFHKIMLVWIPVKGKSKCFATSSNEGGSCPVSNLQKILSKAIKNPELLDSFENKEEVLLKIKHIAFKLNLQAFYCYNVITLEKNKQEQGILYLKTTAHNALKELVSEYLDADCDPLDINNGIWFKFMKSVDNGRTSYGCQKYMIKSKDSNGKIKEDLYDAPIEKPIDDLIDGLTVLKDMYKITPDEEVRLALQEFLKSQIDMSIISKLSQME